MIKVTTLRRRLLEIESAINMITLDQKTKNEVKELGIMPGIKNLRKITNNLLNHHATANDRTPKEEKPEETV